VSECDRFERVIRSHISGENVAGEWSTLIEHCRDCPDCHRLLALHAELSDLGAEFVELEDAGLDVVRARVMERVARGDAATAERRWLSWIPLAPALRPLAAGALALLVFVSGVLIGSGASWLEDSDSDPLLSGISADAASNRRLNDVENSPYTYSNVSFRRVDEDRVALSFDVTTHVQTVEPVRSELVKEVLVHSLLNPSHTGSRLKAISYAAEVMDPKVRDALLFAMRRDQNLAVRQKALEILGRVPADPAVEAAVLETLREDESVRMRLLALDFLASRSFDPEVLRRTVGESVADTDAALMVRLADYDGR
jgi:hypothetical protein